MSQEVPDNDRSKAKPKPIMRLRRPNAIKIKTSGELSYSDIIRTVRAVPDHNPLGETVTCIRCTREGELLLGLKNPELQAVISSTFK